MYHSYFYNTLNVKKSYEKKPEDEHPSKKMKLNNGEVAITNANDDDGFLYKKIFSECLLVYNLVKCKGLSVSIQLARNYKSEVDWTVRAGILSMWLLARRIKNSM